MIKFIFNENQKPVPKFSETWDKLGQIWTWAQFSPTYCITSPKPQNKNNIPLKIHLIIL